MASAAAAAAQVEALPLSLESEHFTNHSELTHGQVVDAFLAQFGGDHPWDLDVDFALLSGKPNFFEVLYYMSKSKLNEVVIRNASDAELVAVLLALKLSSGIQKVSLIRCVLSETATSMLNQYPNLHMEAMDDMDKCVKCDISCSGWGLWKWLTCRS
jgi:hypothetical protein